MIVSLWKCNRVSSSDFVDADQAAAVPRFERSNDQHLRRLLAPRSRPSPLTERFESVVAGRKADTERLSGRALAVAHEVVSLVFADQRHRQRATVAGTPAHAVGVVGFVERTAAVCVGSDHDSCGIVVAKHVAPVVPVEVAHVQLFFRAMAPIHGFVPNTSVLEVALRRGIGDPLLAIFIVVA